MKTALMKWNRSENGDMYSKEKNLRELANESQAKFDSNPSDIANQEDLKKRRKEAEEAELIVESYLQQKSRCIWLKEGDNNSRFFYISIKTRRNRNVIKCIEDGDIKISSKTDIKDHIDAFYKNLYN